MPRYTSEVQTTPSPPPSEQQSQQQELHDETYAMPATPGQLRFWSLDQLNPGNPALNMPLMWRCTGPLDVEAMTAAFSRCVARHEMLRTTFALTNGRLSQIIDPPCAVDIAVVDLESEAPQAQRLRADELTRAHAAYRFDLEHGPLLVLKLLRFDAGHHLLLVSMHHIICDGISLGILMRDMAAFYDEAVRHTPARLPELPIQFADFAVWQEQWLASDEPARSLEFWKQSLGNDFPRLNLTRDPDALAAQTGALASNTGDIETLQVPLALQTLANSFCKRENVTLNILLFAVFAALLRRLTGQLDLVIGSPCANRTEDTQELIGLFMNIQVMRLRLAEDETFRQLLKRVQDWTLGAYENQELPFENLVHDPFFANGSASLELPIFFLYQKSFMQTYQTGGVEIVPLRSESPGAVFEMFFAIVDRLEDGPRLQLEYNPRYFKASTIQRYLHLYVALLESALSAPETRIDTLLLLKGEARHTILNSWNDPGIAFPPFESVPTSFLRQASTQPDRIALECNGATWTNAQLASYSQRLAARLIAEGLQPEGLVAICIRRTPEMAGAVLAVMMAGGAYVPMDPRHPAARLEAVLADSGADFLLAAPDLALNTSARRIDPFQPQPDYTGPPAEIAPHALAYVIYTSGSTGTPKGVAIEHAGLVNLLRSMQRTPGLNANDVLVAITTLAFDIAGLELLLPLITGARLVIATTAEVQDGQHMLDLLQRTRATVLQATPGAWRILLDAGWSPSDTPLKALCGAEALPRDLAERILKRSSELWNLYGPTETTIWSTATRVVSGMGPLTIGPPIANTQMYVLDAHCQPQPVGVTGELYIAGAGLARGYWGKPALTAEKFVANPFTGGRMYATGDLARWQDDGSLQLLGRSDLQVKIRGYRIELSEIETALRTHPGVKDAVVTQHKSDSTGATRLTAYIAAGELTEDQSTKLIDEVRVTIEKVLPEFMLPNAFVTLPALPRNPNGKVDLAALPSPTTPYGESGTHSTAADPEHYVAPSDVIESQLADIWQTTLGLPRVSVRASFFSLGVGSLAALRLITKMNRVYAMDLGLASLISASSISSIAELIKQRFAPNVSSSVVPLQPLGHRRPLYIVHGVGGNIVNFYGLAMRMGTDTPIYGIQSQALVARQPALLHLKDMAAHYIKDIRKVQPHGPYDLLGYSFGGTVVLEMAHQLRALGEQVTMLGMIDARSRDYEEELASLKPTGERVSNRVSQFSRNTGNLSPMERLKYIADKLNTRAIRFACMAAARLHMKQVPAFMRSAYDINYVAVLNYKPRPYDGRLTLFRASEQDSRGPHDLGWGQHFHARCRHPRPHRRPRANLPRTQHRPPRTQPARDTGQGPVAMSELLPGTLRQVYMVLSPRSLGYAKATLESLFANALEPLAVHLITDSKADAHALTEATQLLGMAAHTCSVTAEEELADAESTLLANLPNLRAFRHGHPCWRKITDPLLLSQPGEELVLLDPDLYFPNRFTFEQTPATGLLLMWQKPNCLLPPEVVRGATQSGIKLARHVDIGVSHWRAGADLEWIDWLIAKLGGTSLPRMMHVEAIVWAAIAMREGGGYLDPSLWVCWHRTQTKRLRRKLGADGNAILASEPWPTLKCFHAGGEAKWWVPGHAATLPTSPAGITRAGTVKPFVELTPAHYEREQRLKNMIGNLGYYKLFKAEAK